MLKKRLVGVITVKDGWAVQSFGYTRHLPLGRPECLAENLDRWGVDEIIVMCVDRSARGEGPDLALVRRLGALGLSTPLVYGGGIRTVSDAGAVIQSGADRLCVDNVLRGDPAAVRAMAELVGAQAVIGVLPLSADSGDVRWLDHLTRKEAPITAGDLELFSEGIISEAMVVDWRHEGRRDAFDARVIQQLPIGGIPVIAFGGISETSQMAVLLDHPQVVAVAVGNFLSYREHAVQHLRRALSEQPIRPAAFVAAS